VTGRSRLVVVVRKAAGRAGSKGASRPSRAPRLRARMTPGRTQEPRRLPFLIVRARRAPSAVWAAL